MGIGEAEGEDAAEQAIRGAIESPLFDNMSINGSMGVIVNYEFHPEFPFYAISESMEIIQEAARSDADIIFGTMPREEFEKNKVRVSIIATGFEQTKTESHVPVKTQPAPQTVAQEAVQAQQHTPVQQQNLFSKQQPDVFMHHVGSRVGNGDYVDDELDTPTYIRNQKD